SGDGLDESRERHRPRSPGIAARGERTDLTRAGTIAIDHRYTVRRDLHPRHTRCMHMGNILLRRFVAIFAMAALLFMQLAVSAYACTAGMNSAMVASPVMPAAGDCDETIDAQPLLCHSHCAQGAQSL